jgi:hypothetical protein
MMNYINGTFSREMDGLRTLSSRFPDVIPKQARTGDAILQSQQRTGAARFQGAFR